MKSLTWDKANLRSYRWYLLQKITRCKQTWELNWILKRKTLSFDSTRGTFISSRKNWKTNNIRLTTDALGFRNMVSYYPENQLSFNLKEPARQGKGTIVTRMFWKLIMELANLSSTKPTALKNILQLDDNNITGYKSLSWISYTFQPLKLVLWDTEY